MNALHHSKDFQQAFPNAKATVSYSHRKGSLGKVRGVKLDIDLQGDKDSPRETLTLNMTFPEASSLARRILRTTGEYGGLFPSEQKDTQQ